MKTQIKHSLTLLFLFSFFSFNSLAQVPPNLNSTSSFGVLSGGDITATDSTYVNGDAGAYGTIDTIISVYGSTYENNVATVSTALNDLSNAIVECNNQSGISLSQFNDTTLGSAVYIVNGSFILTDTLTLQGNESSVFIFNITDSAYFAVNSLLYLDGVHPSNIFFNVTNNLWLDSNCVQLGVFLVAGNSYLYGENYSNRSILTIGDITITGKIYTESSEVMVTPFLTSIYEDEACNLDYVSASVKLNWRLDASGVTSVNQPALININIPANATIRQAFVWFSIAGSPLGGFPLQNINFGFRDPAQPTNLITATRIGVNAISSTCWPQFQRTSGYRADVTAYITNNISNLYEISQLPVSQNGGPGNQDTWGATLLISYTVPCLQENFWGYIHISDGLRVNYLTNTISTDITNIPTPLGGNISFYKAFLIVGDLEMPITTNSNTLLFQGIPQSVSNPQMWNFIEFQPAPGLTNTTTQYSFTLAKTSIDCHNFSVSGVYYRTTNQICNIVPPPAPKITGNISACALPTPQTYSVTNIIPGATYDWQAVNGTPAFGNGSSAQVAFPPYQGGSITFTVTDANGCTNLATYTVYPCCEPDLPAGDIDLSNMTSSQYYASSGNQYIFGSWIAPNTGGPFIIINGTFTVDIDFVIDASNILLGPNARIDIRPGVHFQIRRSWLHDCGSYMWDGIYISDATSEFILATSFVESAQSAVNAGNDAKVHIQIVKFNKNFVAVSLDNYTSGSFLTFSANHYICTDNVFVNPPYNVIDLISLPPFVNRRSYRGIQLRNCVGFYPNIDYQFHSRNIFYNLNYGIFALESDIFAYNNFFDQIRQDVSFIFFEGSAIFTSSNSITTNNLSVGADDPIDFLDNEFYNSNFGVYLAGNITSRIEYNFLSTINNTAFSINNNRNAHNIYKNNMHDARIGIHARDVNNSNQPPQFVIDDNQYSTSTIFVNNFSNTAVLIQNSSVFSSSLHIVRNKFNNARYGVFLRNVPRALVDDNEIFQNFFSPNSLQHAGIWVENSAGTHLIHNKIWKNILSNQNAADAPLVRGIHVDGSTDLRIFDNEISKMGYAMSFRGNCQQSHIKCNIMNDYFEGIHLDMATLPTQGATNIAWGNEWNITSLSPLPTTSYDRVQDGGNSIPFDWYYTGVANPTPNPLYPLPSNIVVPIGPQGQDLCTYPLIADDDPRRNDYSAEAADSLNTSTSEGEYIAKEDAYKFFAENPDQLNLAEPEDVVYQDFYNTMDVGIIGEKEYITSMIKQEDYANALSAVTAMTDTNLMEYNFKVVNEIYLNCCVSDTTEMTEAQKLTLENIAYQLPMFSGNAVYQARAILGLEVMDDYSNLRVRAPQNIASSINTKTNVFYPNPTRSEIMINHNCENNCIIEIYDLTGRLVFMENIVDNVISVKSLTAGTYIFKLREGNEIKNEELINVLR
jgi:hypothetical protein